MEPKRLHHRAFLIRGCLSSAPRNRSPPRHHRGPPKLSEADVRAELPKAPPGAMAWQTKVVLWALNLAVHGVMAVQEFRIGAHSAHSLMLDQFSTHGRLERWSTAPPWVRAPGPPIGAKVPRGTGGVTISCGLQSEGTIFETPPLSEQQG